MTFGTFSWVDATVRPWRLAATLSLVLSAAATSMATADVVSAWNVQAAGIAGPPSQRTFTMVHLAMFDAMNAIEGRYVPYLRHLPDPPPGANAEAAAAGAGHGMLVRLFPARAAEYAAALALSLATVADGPAETDGVAFGDAVAQALFTERLTDNILTPGPIFVPGTRPGDYQPTTTTPPQPVNTGAAAWKPFATLSASQFRPNGPAPLRSLTYAIDLLETSLFGGTVSHWRTADQEEIARWHTEMAQFQFNRIARTETATDGRSMLEHARLFAQMNLALADAVTSVFEAKYYYAFWRPITAIRGADDDGNWLTRADPAWTQFLPTPPHPEYPAAHGAVQAAAGRVMNAYFGRHYGFFTTAAPVPGVTRAYRNFDAFVNEGSMARIYGGMHFRHSLIEGQQQGRAVGDWVLKYYLRELK